MQEKNTSFSNFFPCFFLEKRPIIIVLGGGRKGMDEAMKQELERLRKFFGEHLRNLRKRKFSNGNDLARLIGVSRHGTYRTGLF